MFPPLPPCDRFGARLGVVHLLRDTLLGPGRPDPRVEVHDILGPLPQLSRVEDDVVMMEIQDHRDVQLFAHRQEVMDAPRDVVVLEHQPLLDLVGQFEVILLEPLECGFFVSEHPAEVEDHHCVPVELFRHVQQGQEFGVVLQIPDGIIDDLLSWRSELRKLRNGVPQ
jgi:hypothetical protein